MGGVATRPKRARGEAFHRGLTGIEMMITPVLLAGGSGTRLWPLSRKSYPKQFTPLIGDQTPFQASARRRKVRSSVSATNAGQTVATNAEQFVPGREKLRCGVVAERAAC